MRIFLGLCFAIFFSLKVSASNAIDPSKYIVFNIQDQVAAKLLISEAWLEKLDKYTMHCALNDDSITLWSTFNRSNNDLFELTMTAATPDEINNGNPTFTTSQILDSFQSLGLFGKRSNPQIYFSVLNGKYSFLREELEKVPDIHIEFSSEESSTRDDSVGHCQFYEKN